MTSSKLVLGEDDLAFATDKANPPLLSKVEYSFCTNKSFFAFQKTFKMRPCEMKSSNG